MVKVFLVDDHPVFRSGLRAELGAFASLEIVGEAGCVGEAVEGIVRTAPDVVLLDVHMPDGGGVGVIRGVRASGTVERPQFLALSVSDAAEDVISVIRAGARGYVTKSIGGAELAELSPGWIWEMLCFLLVWLVLCWMRLLSRIRRWTSLVGVLRR